MFATPKNYEELKYNQSIPFYALIMLLFIIVCSSVKAEEVKIPKGFSQAKIPSELSNFDLRLGQMKPGDTVVAFADALMLDKSGNVWLNPLYRGFSPNSQAGHVTDLEIRRTKLGYFVRVPFKYKQINGYSVPTYPKWNQVGNAIPGYIPVLGLKVDKPDYQLRLQEEPPAPRKIRIPPNPYSLESNHARNYRSDSLNFRPTNP